MTKNEIISLFAEYGIDDVCYIDSIKPLDITFDINIHNFITESQDIIAKKLSLNTDFDAYLIASLKLPRDIYSFRYKNQILDFINEFKKTEDEIKLFEYLQTVLNCINSDYYLRI